MVNMLTRPHILVFEFYLFSGYLTSLRPTLLICMLSQMALCLTCSSINRPYSSPRASGMKKLLSTRSKRWGCPRPLLSLTDVMTTSITRRRALWIRSLQDATLLSAPAKLDNASLSGFRPSKERDCSDFSGITLTIWFQFHFMIPCTIFSPAFTAESFSGVFVGWWFIIAPDLYPNRFFLAATFSNRMAS